MPNWCMNNLTISHDDSTKLQEFVDAYNNGKTCEHFLPVPSGYYDDQRWYNWCCNNWGTKWDFGKDEYHDPAEIVNHEVDISFNTAWSPPLPAIEQLSLQYPELEMTLEYEEEQGWGGEMTIVNGETIGEREYDIPTSHADFVERDQECHFCLFETPAEDCPPV